jgi:hypothetical protein
MTFIPCSGGCGQFCPIEKDAKQDPNFIQIKPALEINYKEILIKAFKKIPEARSARRKGSYHKHIFECCNLIKHKAFLEDPLFKEENTVVISGIKQGDGMQRRLFLKSLKYGREFTKGVKPEPESWFWKHKGGQLYCYPFRDYKQRGFPKSILNELRGIYPSLKHSGCAVCPVLVLFSIKDPRLKDSLQFYHKIMNQKTLD